MIEEVGSRVNVDVVNRARPFCISHNDHHIDIAALAQRVEYRGIDLSDCVAGPSSRLLSIVQLYKPIKFASILILWNRCDARIQFMLIHIM